MEKLRCSRRSRDGNGHHSFVAGIKPWADMAHFYSWLALSSATLVLATISSEFIRGGRVLRAKLQTNLLAAMGHLMRRNMRRYGDMSCTLAWYSS